MQIAGSRLIIKFQHLIIMEYSNTCLALWANFMVGCTMGSFYGIINCLLNRPRNAIYSKHRVKVLKGRKEAFHKPKAFRMGQTLNRLFTKTEMAPGKLGHSDFFLGEQKRYKINSTWLKTKAVHLNWLHLFWREEWKTVFERNQWITHIFCLPPKWL